MKNWLVLPLTLLSQLSFTIACGEARNESTVAALYFDADPNGVLTGRVSLLLEYSTDPDLLQWYKIYLNSLACSEENRCSQKDVDALSKQLTNLCGEGIDGRDCYDSILNALKGESLEFVLGSTVELQTEVSYPLAGTDPPFSYQYYNRTAGNNLSCGRELDNCGTASVVLHKIPSKEGDATSLDFAIHNDANVVIMSISINKNLDLSFTLKQCVGCG